LLVGAIKIKMTKNWVVNFKGLILIPLILGMVLFTNQAQAATLSLSASVNKVNVGDLVTITVYLNTQSKTINNAEAAIYFPVDLVEVVSLNSQGSVFSLWVEQPNFSNINGQISFNGGIPNPGFSGSGRIVSIIFRAKKAGTASFYFSGAAIRENDGLGTNVLTSQGSTSIEIVTVAEEKPKLPVEEPKKPSESTPATPPKEEPKEETEEEKNIPPESIVNQEGVVVYSTTHPDQNSWYSSKSAVFGWKIPANATAVQTLLGAFPNSTPVILYRPPIYQKEVDNLRDGTLYFHFRYRDNNGRSETTHFRVQVDSILPTNLEVTSEKDANNRVSLTMKAEDELSGIGYYNILIDDQPAIKVDPQVAKNPVILPLLSLGGHKVTVEAYDKAGNKIEKAIAVSIIPDTAPVITKYSEEVEAGKVMTIEGSTIYSQAKVKIVFRNELNYENIQEVITDSNGNFIFNSEPVNMAGGYEFWVYVEDVSGNSPLSEVYQFKVSQPKPVEVIEKKVIPWAERIPKVDLKYLSEAINVLLSLVVIYLVYRLIILRKKLRLEEKKNVKAFKLLVNKANKQIELIEKSIKSRKTKTEEKQVLNELKEIISEIKDSRDSLK
jgi:hypothetical protein